MPRRDDLEKRHWRRVGERQNLAGKVKLAPPLKDRDTRVAIQAGREANRSGTVVVDGCGDCLRHDTTARGDLVQIQVPHVMLEQEIDVSLLDLLALRHICEITDPAIQLQSYGRKNVFATPSRRNRLRGELLLSLCSHFLLEPSKRREIRTEVSKHLPKTSLGELGDVDGAEALVQIVEAVAPLADLRRDEAERIAVVANPPIRALRWCVAHV